MKILKSFRLQRWMLRDLKKYSILERSSQNAILEQALTNLFYDLRKKYDG